MGEVSNVDWNSVKQAHDRETGSGQKSDLGTSEARHVATASSTQQELRPAECAASAEATGLSSDVRPQSIPACDASVLVVSSVPCSSSVVVSSSGEDNLVPSDAPYSDRSTCDVEGAKAPAVSPGDHARTE